MTDATFTPLPQPGELDKGSQELAFFTKRHTNLALALDPKWSEIKAAVAPMKWASFFSGAVDGPATIGSLLDMIDLHARCDSDENVRQHWAACRKAKQKLRDWGDIEAVSKSELREVLHLIDVLTVSPPCSDWSRAGNQMRTQSKRGSWLVKWADQVLPFGRPKVIIMEFIYQANDRFFLEALNTLVQRMQTKYDYVVADPRTCIVNAAELGGEARVRLILPARRKDFGGKHPVALARLPAEDHHGQAVMADWVVPPTKRSPQRTYDGEVHFFKSAEVKQRMGESRSAQPLHLGIIASGGSSGGLGRRILSPFHAPITMRAAVLPIADQPLGPTKAFVDPTTGDVVLPEVPEIARSRGFPAQLARSGQVG